jgi:hypothetical protein
MSLAMVVPEDSMPPASKAAAEIADLIVNPGWVVLQKTLQDEKRVAWRQILSHHTSNCCRPEKKGGVVASLKSAGLDNRIQRRLGRFSVVLELPALFNCQLVASDFLGYFTYASQEHDTHNEATEEACLTVLTFILTIAPKRMHIAPKSMHNIDRVRAAAEEFRSTCVPPMEGGWLEWYIDLNEAPQPGQTVPKAIKLVYIEPRNQAEGAQRVLDVIDVLRTWLGTLTPADPCKCPKAIREQLMTLLAPNQLKTFLLLHNCIFIVNEAPPRKWTFSLAVVAAVSRNDVVPLGAAEHAAPTWAELLKDDRELDVLARARAHVVAPTYQGGTSWLHTQSQISSSSERMPERPPAAYQWHTQSQPSSSSTGP